MTADHVIGLDRNLPWKYSEDLQRFKKRTLNTTVIMGRLTYESINKRPLPDRRNLVVSRSLNANSEGASAQMEFFDSLESALLASAEEKTWVIGGGQIYTLAMPYLTLLDITYVPDHIDDPAAVRFPRIEDAIWQAGPETTVGPQLKNRIYTRHPDFPAMTIDDNHGD